MHDQPCEQNIAGKSKPRAASDGWANSSKEYSFDSSYERRHNELRPPEATYEVRL